MQKVINVLAVASFVVSAGVVVGGSYLYLNKDGIIDGVKQQVMESVMGGLGGALGGFGGVETGGALIPESSPLGGAEASAGAGSLPIPSGFGF